LVDIKVKDQLESFFSNFDSHNNLNRDINEYSSSDKKQLDEGVNYINKNADLKSDFTNNPNNNSTAVTHSACFNDYEELLRKHESEIRNHIKIQHQYRIYSENLKNKIEELEKSKLDYKKTIANFQEVTKIFPLIILKN